MPKLPNEVIIAVDSLGGGGAERVALEIAKSWPRDHARAVLLVAFRSGAYLDALPDNLEVVEIGVSSSPRNTAGFMRRLRRALVGRNVVGVVSHMTGMNRMMLRARALGVVRAPVVVVEHNDFMRNQNIAGMPAMRARLLMGETGWLYRRATAVVGCSEGVSQQIASLFQLPPERASCIPNPVDPRFAQIAQLPPHIADVLAKLKRPLYVSVGRLVEQKGFSDLIRAFAMQPSGSLVILGEGGLRPELEALATSLGVNERIWMPGFLSSPESVLQNADVYVSASLWEGYPLALIEAYACGLPVVARACDFGPEEIVTAERPGVLVRSGRIEDLAAAMSDVAANATKSAPGSIPLPENDASHVALRYRALFSDLHKNG